MKLLAIETSCDETALTILQVDEAGPQPAFLVLSHIVHSQADLHAQYGGVFPNLAKREHAKNIFPLLQHVLGQSGVLTANTPTSISSELFDHINTAYMDRQPELSEKLLAYLQSISKPDLDAIMVTTGPGLSPALWVGINVAKTLATVWEIPLVPVNHMEGHIVSVFAEGDQFMLHPPQFPALALLISGGHTELVLMRKWKNYEKIGQTKDDAVGEAFDKTARLLGLKYPGGPKIEQLALSGKPNPEIIFPRPMINTPDYDFSFSGLKTAVRYYVQQQGDLSDQHRADIALEFEHAVTDVLLKKTTRALAEFGIKTLIISGGVSASEHIRNTFTKTLAKGFPDTTLLLPEMHVTGDNSLMIGIAGYYSWNISQQKNSMPQSIEDIDLITAQSNMSF
jgi:N6-L-threonylcarbamoyladenine synthase